MTVTRPTSRPARTRSRRGSSGCRSHPTNARDLRRDRRPRPPQAAARALQPRPRGRAAGALQPDRRLARRAQADEDFRADRRASRSERSRARGPTRRARRAARRPALRRRARSTTPACTPSIERTLGELDGAAGEPIDRVFYLSTAPEFFPVIIEELGERGARKVGRGAGADRDREAVRLRPRASARELNARVLGVFDESQVFRIDHYLGKETVQNMLAFRFANGCSSRCGTATTSTTSRSPRPRTSASAAAPATTTARARCATWSRTTCCSC